MKIFATVGTQLPFDRLIRELDAWAQDHADAEAFAQTGASDYEPRCMPWSRTLTEKQFRESICSCDVVVAHAGMGTIISAIEQGKRVVVMPRRAEFGEHRNDHQVATVKRLGHLDGLEVAHSGTELFKVLGQLGSQHRSSDKVDDCTLSASPSLISEIRFFAGLESR